MSDLPDGLIDFLAEARWDDAEIDAIPGDASFRRYFRLRRKDGSGAMLMFAPPPHEDPLPFLNVADWLNAHHMRAPEIYHSAPAQGWVLLEDFGNDRMRDWLDLNPGHEQAAYEASIDALVDLHLLPAGPFAPYSMDEYLREVGLFTEWYAPAIGLAVDSESYLAAWREVLTPVAATQSPGVTVLRDYHAENIMLLHGQPGAPQGLIDFQDALVGHPAYDLVSLLQDARRDVDPAFAGAMCDYYRKVRLTRDPSFAGASNDRFLADYAVLGAQRNAKIVGIFTRLFKRDGKARYLDMIPRVWALLEADLRHPALEPVARWFGVNIPEELRRAGGGTIA